MSEQPAALEDGIEAPSSPQILRGFGTPAPIALRRAGMPTCPPAIVVGVDSPIGLSVVRELGAHGVPVHGIGRPDAIGAASRHCTAFTPRPDGDIADWLPAIVAESGAGALFAVGETDLLALSALPAAIGGCRILTPRAEPLALVLDKSETLRRAAAIGIDTPESWQPVAGEDFSARAATLRFPVVAKWADPADIAATLAAHGIAFIKAEFLRSPIELAAALDRYAALGRWPLVQDYCPGFGLGQMIHMADGEATLAFQHRRLHEWPPEGGVSTWCAAEPPNRHRRQMARSRALLAGIGWEGPAMVEYRYDPVTGRYWLMEINGRFWGSLPLARYCGAHFAWEQYRRALLGDITPAPAPRSGLRARYMIAETRRLARILFNRAAIGDPAFVARPIRDIASYLLAFLDPRTRYYVFSLVDLGPSLADLRSVFRKLARRETPPRVW